MFKRVFETALEKIGRLLASQFGLRVIYKGSVPYTNGKEIFLPANPDKLSPEIIDDLNGFLDHEVGHCKFTDFGEWQKIGNGPGSRLHRELVNACEDVRIERLMIKAFPGCSVNLNQINKKYRGKLDEKWATMALPVRATIAVADTMTGWKTPKDQDVEAVLEHVEDEVAGLNACRSTKEIRELTKKIQEKFSKLFEEAAKAAEESEKGDGEDSESDSGKGSEGDGKGSESDEKGEDEGEGSGDGERDEEGDSEGSGGEAGEDEGEEKSGGSDKGADGDDESDEEGSGDDETGSGDDESDGAGDKGSDDSEGNSEGSAGDDEGEEGEGDESGEGDGETGGMPKVTDRDLEAGEARARDESEAWDAAPISLEDALNREINGDDAKPIEMGRAPIEEENINVNRHIPFSTEFDEEPDVTGQGDKSRYDAARREVMAVVNPIKAALERELKVIENARWRSEQERGQIDSRSLARLATNKAYRKPFKTEVKTDTTNVAVEILIDQSGSMNHGNKIGMAKQTAIALAEALKELGIAFEVTGFHSCQDDRLRRMEIPEGYNRARERLVTTIFKNFDRNELTGIDKLYVGEQNPDGEAVRWAANRLSMRREKRKVLIVLSDGEPATADAGRSYRGQQLLRKDLKDSVAAIMKAGIEVIGFGIQTEAVRAFYPEWVVVNELKELPNEAMRKLAEILRRGFDKAS